MRAANQVTDHLSIEDTVIEEDLTDTYLGTIHACFNLGFEVSSCHVICSVLSDDTSVLTPLIVCA